MGTLWKSLSSVIAVCLMTATAHAADKTIKIGTMSWEDLTPITAVTKHVLEDEGYKVQVTNFSDWGIAYAALSKGDVQILASQVDYASHDYWNRNKSRLEKISPVSFGLYQAIAVPKYVPIDSMEDLNANADKFQNKIIGIEPGSGLMAEAQKSVAAYGLKLQLVDGSTAAMTAALKSAMDRKDWIAVTVWSPSWMMQKYDVKFLKDPKHIFSPPQTYYWIGKKGFSAENPHVREILAGIYLPLDAIVSMNGEMKDGKSVDDAAKDWVAKNADLVKRWEDIKKN